MTFVKRALSALALATTLIAPNLALADDACYVPTDAGDWQVANVPAGAEADLSFALGMQEKVDRPEFLDGREVKDSQAYK